MPKIYLDWFILRRRFRRINTFSGNLCNSWASVSESGVDSALFVWFSVKCVVSICETMSLCRKKMHNYVPCFLVCTHASLFRFIAMSHLFSSFFTMFHPVIYRQVLLSTWSPVACFQHVSIMHHDLQMYQHVSTFDHQCYHKIAIIDH